MFLGFGLGGVESEWTPSKAQANLPSPFLPGLALAWATELVTDSSYSLPSHPGTKGAEGGGPLRPCTRKGPQNLGCERWERFRERETEIPVSACLDVAALT